MPIYRQISEQIADLIRAGKLGSGDHLPPERELADFLKIARGTVKKAYETLVHQKFIVASRGRGSLVAGGNHLIADNRQGIAAQKISDTIIALEALRFSYREIADLFGLMLAKRREEIARFAIAVVDCNPEALGIYQKQLAMLTHMSTARILLEELRAAADADSILAPFDLVLTTENHIEELQLLAPMAARKAIPVMVSPTQNTLIALARLSDSSRIGIIHITARFREIIDGWLKKSGCSCSAAGFIAGNASVEELEGFVADKHVLILPPGYAAQLPGALLPVLNRFRLNGGQVIDFDYQIERGSLMHLEELIKTLLNQPRK